MKGIFTCIKNKINVKYFLIPFISVYVHERKCAYECVYL